MFLCFRWVSILTPLRQYAAKAALRGTERNGLEQS
jgi:hypothetical protein